MVRTTIMMVTYNRLNLTKKTFETTFKYAGEKFNLVIVDNNSSDDTVKWLEENISNFELIEDYKIIRLNKNKGIAYGRNMGLVAYNKFYNTDYLSTIDNDVVLPSNWLTDCCNVLKNNSKIAACGVNLEGIRYNKAFIKNKDSLIEIQIKQRGNLGTAATVFKKEIFDKIGFFHCYDTYAHEDADYFFRVRSIKPILAYLGKDGIHLGVGEEDEGEYREMKNKYWEINMPIYNSNIRKYINGEKSVFVKFSPDEEDGNI